MKKAKTIFLTLEKLNQIPKKFSIVNCMKKSSSFKNWRWKIWGKYFVNSGGFCRIGGEYSADSVKILPVLPYSIFNGQRRRVRSEYSAVSGGICRDFRAPTTEIENLQYFAYRRNPNSIAQQFVMVVLIFMLAVAMVTFVMMRSSVLKGKRTTFIRSSLRFVHFCHGRTRFQYEAILRNQFRVPSTKPNIV